jgi:syntaxin 16
MVKEIEQNLATATQHVQQLADLYKKSGLFGFDDKHAQEHSIDQKSSLLDQVVLYNKLIRNTQKLISSLYKKGDDVILKNMQSALANKLHAVSAQYRSIQNQYLNSIISNPELGLHNKQSQATQFNKQAHEDGDLDLVFTDAELRQVASNNIAITEREKEINQIAKSILGLAEIFKELNVMVIDQGSVLDRIDYNIEQTNVHLESAHKELTKVANLTKASQYQNNTGAKVCIGLLLIAIIIVGILIYMKRRK